MLAQHVWPIHDVSVPGVAGMSLSMFLGWRLLKAIANPADSTGGNKWS